MFKWFIIRWKSWIFLICSAVFFTFCIVEYVEYKQIDAFLIFFAISLSFLFIWIVKRKIYVKFLDSKLCINVQEHRYSFKMKVIEINFDDLESLEIVFMKKVNLKFWIGWLFKVLFCAPYCLWSETSFKLVIHKKSWDIINLRVSPLEWSYEIRDCIELYCKEKKIKLIKPENLNL